MYEKQPPKRVRNRRVNLRGLKAFAIERLPLGSALRDVLLAERDEVDATEFLAKIDVWLALLRRDIVEGAR